MQTLEEIYGIDPGFLLLASSKVECEQRDDIASRTSTRRRRPIEVTGMRSATGGLCHGGPTPGRGCGYEAHAGNSYRHSDLQIRANHRLHNSIATLGSAHRSGKPIQERRE